jgi:hypothetical protein
MRNELLRSKLTTSNTGPTRDNPRWACFIIGEPRCPKSDRLALGLVIYGLGKFYRFIESVLQEWLSQADAVFLDLNQRF